MELDNFFNSLLNVFNEVRVSLDWSGGTGLKSSWKMYIQNLWSSRDRF